MALIRVGFFSEVLGMCTSCDVILPQPQSADEPVRLLPTLVLLHSYSKRHDAWQRMTGIERYAHAYNTAVIMPDAQQSSYTDMCYGGRFFTHIADELLPAMRAFFPLSNRREDNFIAGCSMGGYGALKIGISRPDCFSCIGSLSAGHISYRGLISGKDDRGMSVEYMTFGDVGPEAEKEEFHRRATAIVASGKNIPRIFISCGQQDPLLLENARNTRDYFRGFEGNPFAFEYTEFPGTHNWNYWDEHIRDFFRFVFRE